LPKLPKIRRNYVILLLTGKAGEEEKETEMNTKTIRYQTVNIVRIEAGHYTVKNAAGTTIHFDRLRDAQNFIIANWGKDLIEAQFAA
jgi:hypothetical protein